MPERAEAHSEAKDYKDHQHRDTAAGRSTVRVVTVPAVLVPVRQFDQCTDSSWTVGSRTGHIRRNRAHYLALPHPRKLI